MRRRTFSGGTLSELLDAEALSKSGVVVVYDAIHGTGAGVLDAVGKLLQAYIGLRTSPDETFLDTVRRLGVKPFREAVYGQAN